MPVCLLPGTPFASVPQTHQAHARLARPTTPASPIMHIDVMAEAHPFTLMIRRNAWQRNLYGWIVFERQREREISRTTCVTQREAEKATKARMIEPIATWRGGRR